MVSEATVCACQDTAFDFSRAETENMVLWIIYVSMMVPTFRMDVKDNVHIQSPPFMKDGCCEAIMVSVLRIYTY